MDIERIRGAVARLKLTEKTALVGGGITTCAVDGIGIETVCLTEELDPYFASEPSAVAMGCTFSHSLSAAVGKARSIAAADEENVFAGVIGCGLILDPMKSDAADFISEDPIVVSELLKSYASAGVIGYVFTDALGQGRYVNRTIDSRALYELYLYPLSHAGAYAGGLQLDGGYVNGKCVASSRSVYDIYSSYIPNDAMIMTQYGDGDAMSVVSGGGAYLLGADAAQKKRIAKAVESGDLFENKLNKCVERTLSSVVKAHEFYKKPYDTELPPCNIIYDSAVLLKNDGVLPTEKTISLFGDASMFDDSAAHYVQPIKNAAKKHGTFNVFLITDYAGGIDAETMQIICTASTTAKTVVVLCGGVAVELGELMECANAVMYMPYCPNVYAIVQLLTAVAPRGHLPFTWCKEQKSYPRNNAKYLERGDFRYESMYNGYMLFNNFEPEAVAYPFGHGLDYTKYEISQFKIDCDKLVISLDFVIKNSGAFAGTALLQAYVTYLGDNVYGLSKRLASFRRVALEKTENSMIHMDINLNDLAVYDESNNALTPVGGRYLVELGLSSTDIRASAQIKVPAGSRVNAGLNSSVAPSYYAVGKRFEPTAPEIEKLLKVPFIKKPDEHPELDPPQPAKTKRLIKKAEKSASPRLITRIKYKIENTPIGD